MNKRIRRVNELIKKELGEIIVRELDLSEGVFVTITRVEVSSNLQEAKVYISVIPDESAASALRFLRKNVFYFQQLLNKRLRMRPVPKIAFMEEKATKETAKVEELMGEIHKNI